MTAGVTRNKDSPWGENITAVGPERSIKMDEVKGLRKFNSSKTIETFDLEEPKVLLESIIHKTNGSGSNYQVVVTFEERDRMAVVKLFKQLANDLDPQGIRDLGTTFMSRLIDDSDLYLSKVIEQVGFVASRGEAKRLIAEGGIMVNGIKIAHDKAMNPGSYKLQKGRRHFANVGIQFRDKYGNSVDAEGKNIFTGAKPKIQ